MAKSQGTGVSPLMRRHLLIGWSALFVFASLGVALEVFHGLKLSMYLDTRVEIRRLMWTLAHAHGTLLGLVHIGFGLYLAVGRTSKGVSEPFAASVLLSMALILIPLGFFLGGIWIYDGDPGLGVLLTPLGAICFLAGLAIVVQDVFRSAR